MRRIITCSHKIERGYHQVPLEGSSMNSLFATISFFIGWLASELVDELRVFLVVFYVNKVF
jgi:hypothetical protein